MTRTIRSTAEQEGDDRQLIDILESAELVLQLFRSSATRIKKMGRFNPKQDEYDINFEDTRDHAVERWGELVSAALETLSSQADRTTAQEPRDWKVVTADIKEKADDACISTGMRKLLRAIHPLPRTMSHLSSSFEAAVDPLEVNMNILWGLLYLNIKLSMESPEKLNRTVEWLIKLRRTIERFNQCCHICEEKQESTLAMVDFFDHTLSIMCESARYLRRSATREDTNSITRLLEKITVHQRELEETIRHLSDLTSYSQANVQQQIKNLSIRHSLEPDEGELARFPLIMLPFKQNRKFYGRREELAKMDQYLKWEGNSALRTFSIYGRRGVGKTEIALEYAHRNPSRFDAIFWIGCETTLSLRQSFTNMAIKLNIPGADSKGNHEENLLNVQKWLKLTKRRWLMIFDNADKESEPILRGYWPIGASGAILITSRNYYNFMKDINRKGETIKPFGDQESWDLLLRLLGNKWVEASNSSLLKQADIAAAKAWMKRLGGLPLSIQTAASLITSPKNPDGFSISDTFLRFQEHEENLPPRYRAERSPMIKNLDALFDMMFTVLSQHARDLLSILALLSPDEILIELFLPRRQDALDGKLAFAKQEAPLYVDSKIEAALTSIINLTPALSAALDELKKANLIRWDHRSIAVHRVVQEAMNYHTLQDLQNSFNSAVHLVYEAFPKQKYGNTLYEEWPVCSVYITHAVHLSKKFSEYQSPGSGAQLTPSEEFVELLSNAAWYLYEMSDYDLSRKVLNLAKTCEVNKESILFAHLCNTQGCNYYDLNRTVDCRRNWEIALKIRENLQLEPKKGDIAISLHNMGNLEAATGHYEEALSYYNRAVQIRMAIGDRAALQLGTTYLGIGRCHAYYKSFGEARKMFAQAEQLFVRTVGADKYFMANCHYAYGNIELEEKLYPNARRSFEMCLNIASAELPIHPITAAAYYSLGCTEFAIGNIDPALGFLAKARNIAELRSPGRDDGTVARILWKTAQVLRNNPAGVDLKAERTAGELLGRAYLARATLIASNEAAESDVTIMSTTGIDPDNWDAEEDSFDQLVPGYFR